jgi:ribosomal protein L11 methyltransferase
LCLEWLERQDLGGKALLDYGCGSGILGVAALKLGAASAHGVDIDDQALTASDDNAKKNGLSGALALFTPEQMPAVRYDVIVANILAGPLVELAGELAGRVNPGGAVALSGILAEQADDIRAAYQAEIEFDAVERCEEWFLLSGRKRAEPSHVHTLP